MSTVLLACLLASSLVLSALAFDIRNHISTSTRYTFRRTEAGFGVERNADPPPRCCPFHINLVARHGTRAPTLKRMGQLDQLEAWIRVQADLSTVGRGNNHEWLSKWESPWKGKRAGGELVPFGEDEMYGLGGRFRGKFPEIFSAEYHPEIYKIFASQVPRASASAVAFGLGLFAEVGALGPGRHRAFSVVTESRANDTQLRFHDSCRAYKAFIKDRKPAVVALQNEIYGHVASSLSARLQFNLSGGVIASLWLLCKQEAAVLDITNQACSLFSGEQVELLEWADDVGMYHLKGYGAAINYLMATNLLSDALLSMQHVITTSEGRDSEAVPERARLRFAHAETLIPFICLLGLFRDKEDVESKYYKLRTIDPVKVPIERVWKGSKVAPFGANTALVLYKCPRNNGASGGGKNLSWRYLVQVLHNEQAVLVPGCDSVFCPFEIFKDKVVQEGKCEFEAICSVPKTSLVYAPLRVLTHALLWPWLSTP